MHLKDGTECSIPNLSQEIIDQIFSHHIESVESAPAPKEDISVVIGTGFKDIVGMLSKLGASPSGSLGKMLEHDPDNADLPDLPTEMIEKIQIMLSVIPKEDLMEMPEAVPGCNCMYCQINRLLHQEEGDHTQIVDEGEPVEETELEFTEWLVENVEDKIFKVTNKLDPHEEYRVFLGDPVGCTCGKPHCEHILAVLRS